MRRSILATAVLAVVGLVTSLPARAYLLPTDFIVRMLIEKRERVTGADLSLQLTTEVAGIDSPVEERIYVKMPERLRRVRQTEDRAEVEVQREGRWARGSEGDLKTQKGPPEDVLPLLLFTAGNDLDKKQERILATLKTLGIDRSVVAFGRYQDQVCFIIGARSYAADASQLWIDKETFLPLRLIVTKKTDSSVSKRETRWLEFGSSLTGDYFPRVIEVLQDGKRVSRSEVEKVESNTKNPETLFDVP
jgi:hypothetical protein